MNIISKIIFFVSSLVASFGLFSEPSDYCPLNYEQARKNFIDAANKNHLVTQTQSLPIEAKGPQNIELSIDIAVMGDLSKAKKIIFHISGTHGAEGGAGSGIQHEFLSNPADLKEDTALIFIHALNPYGMAWNRRVNETNIDLNRNCAGKGVTSAFYAEINAWVNPKREELIDMQLFKTNSHEYGWPLFKKTLMEGQYDYPEGLFYGGKELAQGPRLVLEWCASAFTQLNRDLSNIYFGIIDVHSGLGPYAEDTLITLDSPTDAMIHYFGEKMSAAAQRTTVGYKPTGVFVQKLGLYLQDLTKCSTENIMIIGQEFGTIEEYDVLSGLYLENALFHSAKRSGIEYDPNGVGGQALLKAFYPSDKTWRRQIILLGRERLCQYIELMNRI